jgi:hypothetical protein
MCKIKRKQPTPAEEFASTATMEFMRNSNMPAEVVKYLLDNNVMPTGTKVNPDVKLPTRLTVVEPKPGSDDVVNLYFDNGWEIEVKIHGTGEEERIMLSPFRIGRLSQFRLEAKFVGVPVEAFILQSALS